MKTTPRQLFRKDAESAGKLAQTLAEIWMQKAIAAALGEMAHKNMVQEIQGANEFIEILHSLAEDDKKIEPLPDKSALKSYGI